GPAGARSFHAPVISRLLAAWEEQDITKPSLPILGGSTMLRHCSLRDWFSRRQPKSSLRQVGRTSGALTLETLETRLVPVVGATSWAPTVARGAGFDGVVRIIEPGCTGNLLTTGRHILTAAHCLTDNSGVIDQPSVTVRFEMPSRNGNPARNIDIPVSS